MNGRLSQLLLSSHCLNIDVTRDNILVTTSLIRPNVPITVPYVEKVTKLQSYKTINNNQFSDNCYNCNTKFH